MRSGARKHWRPTLPRPPPDIPPTWGRPGADFSPFSPDFFSSYVNFGHIDQARPAPASNRRRRLEQQLVNETLAAAAAMRQQILQLFQTMQMHFQLRIAPARVRAHVAAARSESPRAPSSAARIPPRTISSISNSKLPRLRRQFIERPAQHFMRQPVRRLDIGRRHFDVSELCRDASRSSPAAGYWCSSAIARISVRYFV